MSVDVFDRLVLSKPYFDRHGLIVAEREGRRIGFAHAGFGASDVGGLSTRVGATCMVMVAPGERNSSLAEELLARSEEYLQAAGVEELYGGPASPADSFYLGLYGGSNLSGVLASDSWLLELFSKAGYREVERRVVTQCQLANFRPGMDRNLRMLKRQYRVEQLNDPPPATWWEACTIGQADRWSFDLYSPSGEAVGSGALFWDLEPLASCWGVHAAGLYQMTGEQLESQPDVAQFLLGEALRSLKTQGVTLVEAHVAPNDELMRRMFERLGFEPVDEVVTLVKSRNPSD